MKKISALALAVLLLLSLAACAGGSRSEEPVSQTAPETPAESVPAPEKDETPAGPEEPAVPAAESEPAQENAGPVFDLVYDYSHMNGSVYEAHLVLNKGDEAVDFDPEEPNLVYLENGEGNYCLDLDLDSEAKEAYEGFQASGGNLPNYTETQFAGFSAWYAEDDGIFGYILLDDTDEIFDIYLNFYLYPLDESEDCDVLSMIQSGVIRNTLNSLVLEVK